MASESTRRSGSCTIAAMRLSLALALIAVITIEGGLGYSFLREQEEKKFTSQFGSTVADMKAQLTATLQAKLSSTNAAVSAFRYVRGGLFVFSDFDDFAEDQVVAARLRNLYLLPIIREHERAAFEAFMAEKWEALSGPDLRKLNRTEVEAVYARGIMNFKILPVAPGSTSLVNYTYFDSVEASPGQSPPEYGPIYAVVTQVYPLSDAWSAVGRDHHNDTVRQAAIDRALATLEPACTDFTRLLQDVRLGVVRAASGIYAPMIRPDEATGAPTVTGLVFGIFNWNEVILQSLPTGTAFSSLNVVVQSPRGTFSFAANGSAGVADLGEGAFHDITGFSQSFALSAGGLDLTFTVYPTRALVDSVLTDLPRDIALAISMTLTGCLLLFACYDVANRRLVNHLVVAAAVDSAKAEMETEMQSSRSVFVSMVSHEIRGPASCIIGALDVLRDSRLSQMQREMCGIISAASADIISLVEDALAVGEGADAEFKINLARTNLRSQVLERSFNTARMQERFRDKVAKVTMTLSVADDVPVYADIDAGRASQVFGNLIGNAIKFCNSGGRITCSADVDEAGALRLRVRDTGIGLSQEGQQRLFKAFSQAEGAQTRAKYGGTGLGLLISRNICRSMGGDLTVSSEGLGKGCEFTALFALINPTNVHDRGAPMDRSSADADSTKRSSHLSRNSSDSDNHAVKQRGVDALPPVHEMVRGSIDASSDDAHSGAPAKRSTQNDNALCCALAEDDGMLRKVTSTMLKRSHFTVDVFPHGVELSDAVRRNPDKYDVIILDANMGGGDLDGLPTLTRLVAFFAERDGSLDPLQAKKPPPPIVLLTGETHPEVHARFIEAGAARVITKPAGAVQFEELRMSLLVRLGMSGSATLTAWPDKRESAQSHTDSGAVAVTLPRADSGAGWMAQLAPRVSMTQGGRPRYASWAREAGPGPAPPPSAD